jgi:hypothetical protein
MSTNALNIYNVGPFIRSRFQTCINHSILTKYYRHLAVACPGKYNIPIMNEYTYME